MNLTAQALRRRRFNSLLNPGSSFGLNRANQNINRNTLAPSGNYQALQCLCYKVWRLFFLSPRLTSSHEDISN